MQIPIREVESSFWEDNRVNVVINQWCLHQNTEDETLEFGATYDPAETLHESVVVCLRCEAWRKTDEPFNWRDEHFVEEDTPTKTNGKLVLQ